MLENGEITPEEAVGHPSKHIITRALGVDKEVKVDFCQENFEDNDMLLLCSDGLTNFVNTEDILKLIGESEFFEFADKLVNHANQNGGADNIIACRRVPCVPHYVYFKFIVSYFVYNLCHYLGLVALFALSLAFAVIALSPMLTSGSFACAPLVCAMPSFSPIISATLPAI